MISLEESLQLISGMLFKNILEIILLFYMLKGVGKKYSCEIKIRWETHKRYKIFKY